MCRGDRVIILLFIFRVLCNKLSFASILYLLLPHKLNLKPVQCKSANSQLVLDCTEGTVGGADLGVPITGLPAWTSCLADFVSFSLGSLWSDDSLSNKT